MRPVFMGDIEITEDVTFTFGVADVLETFETGFVNFVNVTGDNQDWTRQTGGTPSGATGPTGAYAGSYYAYCEASGPPAGAVYWLRSATSYIVPSDGEVSFYYHMCGSTTGTLRVQYALAATPSTWVTLHTYTGAQQAFEADPWLQHVEDISALAGEEIWLQLEYVRGSSFSGDTAVDNIAYNNVSHSVTITAGSWFASALHMWLYVLGQLNTAEGLSATVTLDIDTRTLTIAGAPVCVVPDIAGIGYAPGAQTLGVSLELTSVMSPVWPLPAISFGVENLTGKAAVAHDGTTYSLAGASQETCALTVSIDRMSGEWTEWLQWAAIWHDFWLQGRYVCVYVDSEELPDDATGLIAPGIALQFAGATDAQPVHRLTRLVENKDARDLTDNLSFSVRRENTAAWQLRT